MSRCRRHVLIAGGGVAGLETVLALRALAADRVETTILAPDLKFVNRSMSAQQPFKVQRARGLRLEDTAAELGARWHRGTLDRVLHAQHRAVTRDGEELAYDTIVLALGAHPKSEWDS
jgi:sulfide:quinone oxidoreductase